MFDGSRFLQYLEGPEDGIDSVYQRIANARSHGQLKVLCRAPVAQRAFPRWSMGTRRIEAELLVQIVDASWPGFVLGCGGFERLLQAWTGADGELEPAAVALGS